MPIVPSLRQAALPRSWPAWWTVALAVSTLLAVVLPGGRWSDMLALLASVAALFAAAERRYGDMLIATGLAAGLAASGLLLAPLCLGLAIRHRAANHLPAALLVGVLTYAASPWPLASVMLPNLATVASNLPASLALIVAAGVGIAAWLGARASVLPSTALAAEARLGAIMLAAILPLPLGALGFLLVLAALPIPSPRRLMAANDNMVLGRAIRRAA